MLLVRLAASEAQYQRAKRVGEIFRFPPGIGFRLIWGLGSPFLVYVTYRLWLESWQTGEWWFPVLSGLWALGTLLFRPPDIEVRPDGVYELRFLGLRKKRILWQGAAARFVPG